jgi:4-hydroxymandelate oxidase
MPTDENDSDFDPARFLSVLELAARAERRIPKVSWDYFRSGAWGEHTLRWNVEAWERLRIRHRSLVDVSRRELGVEICGAKASFPLFAAPTALHKLAHPEGEVATARACAAAGVPMVLSSLSSTSVEEVCGANRGNATWMQIYIGQDRGFVAELAARALAAGCTALVLTVDTPKWGTRERDIHNGFRVPDGIEVANLVRPGGPTGHSGRGIGESLGWTISESLSWKDLEWLAAQTPLPVLVKGVCRDDDALRSIDHGARGIFVSNHGGRQLDGAPPTAESLPEVAAAVNGRVPVLVDGGIRRGVDILRALALGADAVAIGRPVLWGLGAGGEAGVRRVLEILHGEFDLAMALAGCTSVRDVGGDLVRNPR